MKANPGRELVPGAIRRHDPGSNWGKVVVKAKSLVTVAALVLLAGACTSSQDPAAAGSATAAATASRAPAALPSSSSPSQAAAGLATLSPAGQSQLRGILASRGLSAAAALPDHGELATYPGRIARATGAYTWHRAGISEAHAINAIASGHMRLTTPDGRLLDIVYDRHIEHPSGDWTWIGHLAGKPHLQTVLTIGAEAVFGTIGQDLGLPLRVDMRGGATWLVETDPALVAAIDNEATRPSRPDYDIPRLTRLSPGATDDGVSRALAAQALAVAGDQPVVDVLVGYTVGFEAAVEGASAALTRIHELVDITNLAYENSGVNARVRLVHAMSVDYTDANSNRDALQALSGYVSGSGPITPDPAFDDLRAARETYGADLVVLVRKFLDPEHEGCGIAWLLGGGLQGITPDDGWDQLGYSVVSDGQDKNEDDGHTYYCREATFAHELGHNMGAGHDKETAKGDDGTLDNPDDYGAYVYSFGYKTSAGSNKFYTVMAYGDSGQVPLPVFSSPFIDYCGGQACGVTDTNNAQTLANTIPVVAGFRATVVPETTGVRNDVDGDGASDVFWRNASDGRNVAWLSADRGSRQEFDAETDLAWRLAAIADFNGDGIADLYWRNQDTGANRIWRSGSAGASLPTNDVGTDWRLAGSGDFDGDGEADVLWRNSKSGKNTIWFSAQQSRRKSLTAISDTKWEVVGVGDFDGDGEADIFWRHATTGKNTVWYSGDRANRKTLRRVSDANWKVAAAGDFNGDGNDDILWRHDGTGKNTIWKSANGSTKQAVTRVATTSWFVAAAGDYDSDGTYDILWRNAANGDNVLWPDADRGGRQVLDAVSRDWFVVP